jgi:hypothetical protein
MIADSWLRSAAAGVNADSSPPPITLAADLLADYRAGHPLAEIFPLLYDVAGRAAEDCDSVLAVADARNGTSATRAPTRPGQRCVWTPR